MVSKERTGDALDPRFTVKGVKHGGSSVTVWGCITSRGVGRLRRIKGIMDGKVYAEILEGDYPASLSEHSKTFDNSVLQLNNNPKHRSNLVWQYLDKNDVSFLHWPSESPNMNPNEHFWDHLDQKLRACIVKPSNKDQLYAALEEEWYDSEPLYIQSLYDSMPRRVQALVDAKCWNTRY
jgi:hypothetical protein